MTLAYQTAISLLNLYSVGADPVPAPVRPPIIPRVVTNAAWKDFHGTPLTVSWLLLINLAVIIAAFRWQRYTFYMHAFMGLLIIGLTLGATIPALQNNTFLYSSRTPEIQKVHNVAGFIVTVWLGFQLLMGILSRVIQYSSKIHPNVVKAFKIVHVLSGYLLMILAKFNYLIIKWKRYELQASFILLLAAEIPFLIVYLLIKFGYWTLSGETVDSQIKLSEKERKAQSIEAFDLGHSIVIKQNSPTATENKKNHIKTAQTHQNEIQLPGTYRSLNPIDQKAEKQQLYAKNEKLKVPYIQESPIKYSSQAQISFENYVIFNDFVYDISDFSGRHPGGEKLISLVKKREINRFMYGSYSAELTPTVKPWKHSRDAMRLVGPPAAQILRSSSMQGLQNYNKMRVHSKTIISPASTHPTFLIHLKTQPENSLQWKGFTEMSQIGQYFSLTLSDKNGCNRVSRLYTNIWCMRPDNVQLMKKNFPELGMNLTQTEDISYANQNNQRIIIQSNNTLHIENASSEQVIPLVIKRYQKGELTQKLLSDKGFDGEIVLSKSMGAGMKYGNIKQEGKVIIICGGTGLLPFCDFIDLLFKRVLLLEGNSLASEFARKDPLVKEDLIKKRSFKLYCAAESTSDLLPLTLFQIEHLSKSQKINFEAIFRIHNNPDEFGRKFPSIKTQKEFFNETIIGELKYGAITQIYVCGPPGMNAAIGEILQSHEQSKGIYHYM